MSRSGRADIRGLVSVVMPAYNAEEHIGEAIRSALNQTYGKLELACAARTRGEFLFTGSFIITGGARSFYVLSAPKRISRRQLLAQNRISCSSALVRRALLLSHPLEEGPFHEDYKLWLDLLEDVACAYGVDEPLLYYRMDSRSKSGNKLRAARMTWNVYRRAGLGRGRAICCWSRYVVRSLRKYAGIVGGTAHGAYGIPVQTMPEDGLAAGGVPSDLQEIFRRSH